MTFEEFMKRPVYRVQCYTYGMARNMGLPTTHFRVLPGYRAGHAHVQAARDAVARRIRQDRASERNAMLQSTATRQDATV